MKYIVFIILCLLFSVGFAQDEAPFKDEIDALQIKYDKAYAVSDNTIVFTGSSSIRMWNDVDQRFPDHTIVNTGFGGSQTSDLSDFLYDLVLRFQPKKVFIYEGDNDIFSKKRPNKIRKAMREVVDGIQRNGSTTQTVLIAAKPSIARWNLRRKYKRLNRKFEQMANDDPAIQFVDVWEPMLDGKKVKKDIFIEDGLHMNKKGYQIWYETLKPFVN